MGTRLSIPNDDSEESKKAKLLLKIMQKGAEGAIPLNTSVTKQNSRPDDHYPDGTHGVIRGSIKAPENTDGVEYCYLVVFNQEGIPTFTLDKNIKRRYDVVKTNFISHLYDKDEFKND